MIYLTYKIKSPQETQQFTPANYDFNAIYSRNIPNLPSEHAIQQKQKHPITFTKCKEPTFTDFESFKTTYINHLQPNIFRAPDTLCFKIKTLAEQAASVLNQPLSERYNSWLTPKKSGGMRQLDEPIGATREFQDGVKELLEHMYLCTHNSAHAYVKKRCPKTDIQVHQEFESKFFLKIDIKDFFGSCSYAFIIQQLKQIYPICGFFLDPDTANYLHTIIRACLLNNGLPQGSPVSPMLSNICMIPVDYAISKACGKFFRYTRYADDILITSKSRFNYEKWTTKIQQILTEQSPFVLKPEKTRFGSSGGENWNLGIMLNADNKITLGHKKKEIIKAMLHNFVRDFDTTPWSREQTRVFQGQLAHFTHIEPDYMNNLLTKYPDIRKKIKSILR